MGALPSTGPWLAPLAGYSDLAFRTLCRRHGAACAVTEMVSAKGLLQGNRATRDLLRTTPEDAPLVVQLFGSEASVMRKAMTMLAEEFRWFDLNMGCPVAKVVKTGCGSGMLSDSDNALAVAKAMIEVAGPGRVGFKLRLGRGADESAFFDLARRLEDAGAAWITLHPRTGSQGYAGEAQTWRIGELARALSIPVIASGDLFTARDGERVQRLTGAAAVMFARGALADPCIFERYAALRAGREPGVSDRAHLAALAREHIALERALSLIRSPVPRMRAVVLRYVRQIPGSRLARQEMARARSLEELEEMLERFAAGAYA